LEKGSRKIKSNLFSKKKEKSSGEKKETAGEE